MGSSVEDFAREIEKYLNRDEDAAAVAAAIARGTDEFGRPRLMPFDEAAMKPLQQPPPSVAQAGLRTGYGDNWAQPGPTNTGLAANMRPSTMIEDRRAATVPSNLPRHGWLESALSNALTDRGPSELETALLENGMDMSSLRDKQQ